MQTTLIPTGTGTDLPADPAFTTVQVSAPTLIAGALSVTVTVTAKNSANVQLAGGGSTVTVTNTGGSGRYGTLVDNGNGTYTVTFFGWDVGVMTFVVYINSALVTTTMPTVTVSLAPPDIADASFEDADPWCSFVKNSGLTAPIGVTRDTAQFKLGAKSVRRDLVTGSFGHDDNSAQFNCNFGAVDGQVGLTNRYTHNGTGEDRIWFSCWLRADAVFNGTIFKLMPFQDNGFFKFGELSIFNNYVGMNYSTEWQGANVRFGPASGLLNTWVSIELDYWFRGCPFTSGVDTAAVKILYNGVDLSLAAPPVVGGTRPSKADNAYWSNGYLIIGGRDATNATRKVAVVSPLQLVNDNNPVAGSIWIDGIRISTKGRTGLA